MLHVRSLFEELKLQSRFRFPNSRHEWDAPDTHGVYVIYSQHGKVLHVGRTLRGKKGLRQRLKNHLHGSSSFTKQYFGGKGAKLRGKYKYSFLEIPDARTRALLEALATGILCPKHVGLSENVGSPSQKNPTSPRAF